MKEMMNQEGVGMEMSSASMGATKKEGSGLKVGMVICAILAVAGIGFGVYGMLNTNKSILNSVDQKEKYEIVTAINNIEELQTAEIREDQEIDITNTYVRRDLDHKMSLLHGKDNPAEDSNTSVDNSPAYNFMDNVYNNTLDASKKAIIVMRDAMRSLSSYENGSKYYQTIDNYIKQKYPDLYNQVNIRYYGEIGYAPYYYVNSLFHATFGYGEDAPKEDLNGTCTSNYDYIAELDAYINKNFIVGGCGGTYFPVNYVRKYSFTAKGDEAYVYVRSGTAIHNENDSEGLYSLYGQYYSTANSHGGKGEDLSGATVITDSLDVTKDFDYKVYDKLQQYKFVFKKNNDGVYSFVKVEKI